MLKFQTILCPIDLMPSSQDALALASSLARDHGGRLIVVHVAPDDLPIEPKLAPTSLATWEKLVREDIKSLEESQPETASVPTEVRVLKGHAVTEILGLAKELPADVIVMATQARAGLPRLLLGSVAEAVLREANCPVIAVRSRRTLSVDHPSMEQKSP